MSVDDAVTDELRYLNTLSVDKLLIRLGRDLDIETSGVTGIPERHFAERARHWLDAHLAELKKTVCGSPRVREMIKVHGEADTLLETAVVLNALMSMDHLPAPAVLAVLLTRIGIRRLCEPSGATLGK